MRKVRSKKKSGPRGPQKTISQISAKVKPPQVPRTTNLRKSSTVYLRLPPTLNRVILKPTVAPVCAPASSTGYSPMKSVCRGGRQSDRLACRSASDYATNRESKKESHPCGKARADRATRRAVHLVFASLSR